MLMARIIMRISMKTMEPATTSKIMKIAKAMMMLYDNKLADENIYDDDDDYDDYDADDDDYYAKNNHGAAHADNGVSAVMR